MAWFWEKKKEFTENHSAVSVAFHHIKNDIQHVFNWLKYFHEKHQSHDERLAKIEHQMQYLPDFHNRQIEHDKQLALFNERLANAVKTPEDVKDIVDKYYSYEKMMERIQALSARVDDIEKKKEIVIEPPKQERNYALRDRLLKKITKNSKDYVKSVIVSMIKKYESIPGSQLREMIVEEQGLCSKSTFYRLLTELEFEHEISTMAAGKEKFYSIKKRVLN